MSFIDPPHLELDFDGLANVLDWPLVGRVFRQVWAHLSSPNRLRLTSQHLLRVTEPLASFPLLCSSDCLAGWQDGDRRRPALPPQAVRGQLQPYVLPGRTITHFAEDCAWRDLFWAGGAWPDRPAEDQRQAAERGRPKPRLVPGSCMSHQRGCCG